MKQIEVTIMGQSYILGCPEGGETSLLEAVSNVDREMSAIRDAGKVKARERIVPEEQIMLVSPNGIVHHSSGYGITDCGKDGTGDGWWWRL